MSKKTLLMHHSPCTELSPRPCTVQLLRGGDAWGHQGSDNPLGLLEVRVHPVLLGSQPWVLEPTPQRTLSPHLLGGWEERQVGVSPDARLALGG